MKTKKKREDVNYMCMYCFNEQKQNGKKFTETDNVCPKCGGKVVKFVCILTARI